MLSLDFTQARAFIQVLTGSPDSTIVLQTADDTSAKRKELIRVVVGKLSDLADLLTKLNTLGAGIWLQVNDGRRGARNVTALRACFIDDDGKTSLPPLIKVPPSIVVQSSAGVRNRHYYWLLQGGEPIDRFTPTQRHLIAHYGTDKAIHNLDRVMRLPGTYNRKRETPELVRLLHIDTSRRWTLESLASLHPLPEAARQQLLSEPHEEAFTPEALKVAQRIGFWLTSIGATVAPINPVTYRMKCPFNPAHGDKLMIRVQSRGGVWAGCWHDSCGGNTNRWSALKDRLGGWQNGGDFSRGDHVELAHRLIAQLSSTADAEVIADQDQLWRYEAEQGTWRPIPDGVVRKMVADFAGARVGSKKTLQIFDSSADGAYSWAKSLAAEPGYFANAPAGIAFANGFLAVLPNGVSFIKPAPENRQSFGLPYLFDPDAKSSEFQKYLHACFRDDADGEEKIDLLQEFIGVCLVGQATQLQKALVLHGEGSNGKSVLLTIVRHLFPGNSVVSIKPQDFASEFYRAQLLRARINLVAEMPEANILSTDAFNAVVSGDEFSARHPYGRPFWVAPICGHIFTCNRLPGTTDQTQGFWRRLLVITWNRVFSGSEIEIGLADRLVANELPGIALWAARGAERALSAGHYHAPASAAAALEEWRQEADPVAAFVAEVCEQGKGSTPSFPLYESFSWWSKQRGHKPMTLTAFGRRMRALKLPSRHTRTGSEYPVVLKVAILPVTPYLGA